MVRLAVLTLSTLLVTSSLAMAQDTAAQPAPPPDTVVATVNGDKITRADLLRFQESLPEQYRTMPLEMVYEPLLSRVIDTHLLAAEAKKQGLADDPVVKGRVAEAEQGVLRDEVLRRTVDAATSDAALQKLYEAAKAQPNFTVEEVRARHILVPDEAAAKEIIARLDKGESFADIAKATSTDQGSAQQGGELGWFTREKMVPEFSEAAFAIEPGSYGKEPVKSQFGYHVIMVEEKRTREPSFDDMKAQLYQQAARQAIEAAVAQSHEGATIVRFNADGSPATQAPAAPAQ